VLLVFVFLTFWFLVEYFFFNWKPYKRNLGGIFATFGVEEKKPKTSMLCVAMAFYRSLLCYVSSREKIEMR